MAAIRVFRRLRDLVDVTFGTPNDGDVVTYDQATDKFKMAAGGSGGGAPANATYITQTANGSLSAEQALGSLSSGILKSTTTTGVVSIAAAGTDYYAPSSTDVAVADGGTGASDAPTARTNLGLGTLATQNGTFSGTSSGTNTGDQTSVTGNAGTATALQTGRTIDGQMFDGTANITVIAPGTHAATSKTTPVDADELPLADSAASFVLKKLTWANLKATIKTYTDTLYPSGSGTSTGTNTGDQTLPTDATLATSDVTTNNVTSTKHGWAPKSGADATTFLNGATTPAYAQVKDSDLATTDVTTNNVSSTKHGFAPKSPASATQFLNGATTPAYAQVKDADLAVTDVTTNNVSTSAHGFAPKAPNDATKYLDGTGAYSVPAGGSSPSVVTSLPGSPTNGQQVVLTDSTTAPTYHWFLVYDNSITANSGAYKWRCIGGGALYNEVAAPGGIPSGSTAYQDFTGGSGSPTVTVPNAGIWKIEFGLSAFPSLNLGTGAIGYCYCAIKFGATASSDTDAVRTTDFVNPNNTGNPTNSLSTYGRTMTRTIASASTALKFQLKSTINTGSGNLWSSENAWIRATPILIG